MHSIARELELARQRLLDLTLRNRLLNYRLSKLRSIRVLDESPSYVYETLVLQERCMTFRGKGPKLMALAGHAEQDHTTALDTAQWEPYEPGQSKPHHTDGFLETPYDNESLDRKLFHVYHQGPSVVEEQGYTVVHLAVAFLEWFESDDSRQHGGGV